MHFYDPAEPFQRDGLSDDFPDDVIDRVHADADLGAYTLWRLPDPLIDAVQRLPDPDRRELAARWETCRCLFLFRGSFDLAIERPPLTDVLSRLRKLALQPRPHGAWIGWRAEG